MLDLLRPALVVFASLTLVTGVAYPAAVTTAATALFPREAGGSLVVADDGQVRGSALVGQPFDHPWYFWSRPSATSPAYNGGASSGSNLGPSNPALGEAVKARVAALREADPGNTAPVPADLVTASASGLDPHVSAAAAAYQVRRVARARGLEEARVSTLVQAHVEGRALGFLGEPRVNVLALNRALDALR